MDIKNLGAKLGVANNNNIEKTKKNEKKSFDEVKKDKEQTTTTSVEKKETKTHKEKERISYAQTISLNLKKKKELAQIAQREAFRKDSLVSEARSNGASKKEAKNGADALMCATGVHTHKSAEDSAKIFKEAGKSAAEYSADAAELKANLKEKFNK